MSEVTDSSPDMVWISTELFIAQQLRCNQQSLDFICIVCSECYYWYHPLFSFGRLRTLAWIKLWHATANTEAPFTQDAKADLRSHPLMLLATCVNTPVDHSVSYNLHMPTTPVARWSASCVNGTWMNFRQVSRSQSFFHACVIVFVTQNKPKPTQTGGTVFLQNFLLTCIICICTAATSVALWCPLMYVAQNLNLSSFGQKDVDSRCTGTQEKTFCLSASKIT